MRQLSCAVVVLGWLSVPIALLADDVDEEYRAPEINLPDGFVAELVAAPPLVAHPLMANFDERDRLFIAESAGRNLSREELEKELPNFIRLLEDTDGDGKFDKSTIFADKMTMPQGALWYRGALYSCSSGGLWRLEDADGDGVADKREKIVGDFGYSGNGADVHGPFLSPAGRIVWCEGRHGHTFKDKEGRIISKGSAARIFSCLPDGSDVEIFCGGGMDNPVEVDFTPEGEMLGVVNLFYRERGDCLVHWVRGGVYPRYDMPDQIAEFPSTGEPLTEVHNYGHVAVAGCTRYRSGAAGFGPDFADHWFMTQFNTHKVVRTVLTRHGGTFRAEVQEFLSSPSGDFHPTDVLEDADGSLLLIDTGGWFLRGCPTSQIAKPNIKGAIWRISKKDAKKIDDPRGLKIAWDKLDEDALAKLMGDERFAVRERAIDTLAQRGEAGVEALELVLNHKSDNPEICRNAVRSLARMRSEKAAQATEVALDSDDPSVRLAAYNAARDDNPLILQRAQKISIDQPAELRAAAAAVGMMGRPDSAALVSRWLAEAAEIDRVTEHALIYAVIEADQYEATHAAFQTQTQPAARRALLVALAQMPSSTMSRDDILPLLASDDFVLRKTALQIAARHPQWAGEIGDALRQWLARPKFSETDAAAIRGAIVAFAAEPAVQTAIAESLARKDASPAAQAALLSALGEMQGRPWPANWQRAVDAKLTSDDASLRLAAIFAIVDAEEAAFAPTLAGIADDAKRTPAERVAALRGLVKFGRPISDAGFSLLLEELAADDAPSRLTAARTLGGAPLADDQLVRLAGDLARLNTLETIPLLAAFERSREPKVCRALLEGLRKSPARAGLPAERLGGLLRNLPEEEAHAAKELLVELLVKSDGPEPADLTDRFAELLSKMAKSKDGDPKRGREVFMSRQAACIACHRIGSDGGTVGPDLSTVGARRSPVDLLEAIAFPSASLARGYESYTLTTTDGKVHNGLILRQTADTLHLRTLDQNEVKLPRSSIDEMQPSPLSIMPQGLDRTLTPESLADLVAYLATLK